jgi:molecular chaperone Hsp33
MGKLIKAMLGGDVLAIACDTTDICEEARRIHELTPVMCAVLGRTISAGVILASRLKNETDSITVNMNGKGPAGTVTVVADANLNVKGYVENPYVDLPPTEKGKLDVSGALGRDGYLSVVQDLGYREPYTGRVSLVSGEIAEDVAQYFAASEGQPCVVFLTVIVERDLSVAKAGGVVLLPMPDVSPEILEAVEKATPELQNFGRMIREMSVEDALRRIFGGMKMTVIEERDARYNCGCSRERLEKVIISLGREEIEDIIEKDRQAEAVCRFCRTKYLFSEDELRALLEFATGPSL